MFFNDKYLLYKFRKTTFIDASFFFSTYLYLSLLSPYMGSLGFSESLKGVFFASFGIVGIFVAPLVGTLSDKIGRFRIIVFGIVLEIITLTGYILVSDPLTLFIFRLIGAVGFNAVTLSALARVNDVVEDDTKRNRVTGLFHSMNALAIMVAPPIGALIADELGYTEVFMTSFILMLIILIGMFIYDIFKHNDHYKHRERGELIYRDLNPFAQVKDFLTDAHLRGAAFLGMMVNFSAPFVTLILPFIIIEQLGLSNFHLGLFSFIFGFVHAFQYYFGILSDYLGDRKSIILGLIIWSSTTGLFFFTNNYFILLTLMFIHSIGGALWNVSMWSHLSTIAEKKNIEGKVIGGYISLSRTASSLSFLVSGALLIAWGKSILLFYTALVFIGLFVSWKEIGKVSVNL